MSVFLKDPFAQAPPPSAAPPARMAAYSRKVFRFSPQELLTPGGEVSPVALWLQSVLSYSAYAPSVNDVVAFATAMGCVDVRLLFVPSADVPHVIGYYWPEGALYCFAGTTSWFQVYRYLVTGAGYTQFGDFPGLVLEPFRVWASALNAVMQADFGRAGVGPRVSMLGHSLGGALAKMIGMTFQQQRAWGVARVVTFGSPRIGTREFAAVQGPRFFRITNDGDPVTRLPPEETVSIKTSFGGIVGDYTLIRTRHSYGWHYRWDDTGTLRTTGIDSDGADNVLSAVVAAASSGDFPRTHRAAVYVNEAQRRLQHGYSVGVGKEPFLDAMYTAYVALNRLLDDAIPPVGPG